MKSFYIKFGSLVIFIISCSQATQENLAWEKAFGIQKSTNSIYSFKGKQSQLYKTRKGKRNATEKIKEKALELEKKTQEAKKQDKKAQESQRLKSELELEKKTQETQQLESELELARKKQEEIMTAKLQAEKEQEAQRLKSELELELELARKKQEEIMTAKVREAEQKKQQLKLEKQIAAKGIIAIEEKIEELKSKLLKTKEEEALKEEAYSKASYKLEEAEKTENEEEKIRAQQEKELASLKRNELKYERSTIEQALEDTEERLKSEQAKLLYAQSGILQDEIKEKEAILNEFFQLTSQIFNNGSQKNSLTLTESNQNEQFSASYDHGMGRPLVSFSILKERDCSFFFKYFDYHSIFAIFNYNKDRLYPILLGLTRVYNAYQELNKKSFKIHYLDETYNKIKELSNVASNFLSKINSMIPNSLKYRITLYKIHSNIHKVKINATIEELSNMKNKIEKWIQKLFETANEIHRRVNSVKFQEFNVLPETEEYYQVFKSINDDDNLQQEIEITKNYLDEFTEYAHPIIKRVIS
ncbi:hypothetical protein [Borrelia duttonii]|nr:hypothetical protein [Borrelia duttonii]